MVITSGLSRQLWTLQCSVHSHPLASDGGRSVTTWYCHKLPLFVFTFQATWPWRSTLIFDWLDLAGSYTCYGISSLIFDIRMDQNPSFMTSILLFSGDCIESCPYFISAQEASPDARSDVFSLYWTATRKLRVFSLYVFRLSSNLSGGGVSVTMVDRTAFWI